MKRTAFWLLVAVTAIVYSLIVLWSLPIVSAAAGGLIPFDMRPAGYSFDEAKGFLAALSPEGKAFYSNVQHRLDIAYPLLIAATVFFSITGLLSPWRWRWGAALLAVPVAAFDWLENAAVSMLIHMGPDALTADAVETASRWTVLKSLSTTVAFSVVLGLLVWRGWSAFARRTRS